MNQKKFKLLTESKEFGPEAGLDSTHKGILPPSGWADSAKVLYRPHIGRPTVIPFQIPASQ